ncbi:MAG: polysaccharide deacetylase family protein [Alphaproteobacteria bacterium]
MSSKLHINILLLILLYLSPSVSLSKDQSIIVLMYHRFDQDKYPDTSISSKTFEEQIKFLLNSGVSILPLTDLIKFLNNEKEILNNTVFLTVDDAFRSFYSNAFPILKKFDLPFSVFVSTKYVSNQINSDYMSWEMLKDLSDNNGLILNHTRRHDSLLNMSSPKIINEIESNYSIIEKNIGKQPKIFSYPYGESSVEVEKIIKSLGYKIAFSQHSSPISKEENRHRLPRFSLNEELGRIERFEKILNVKSMPNYKSSLPDTTVSSEEIKYSFTTDLPLNYINCFINNKAELNIKNPVNSKVTLIISKLKIGNRYRINCTYTDKNGQIYWNGKMLKRID